MASKKHEYLCKLAKRQPSFDRHLDGLKALADKLNLEPKPPIFEDPTFEQDFYLFNIVSSQLLGGKACSGAFIWEDADSLVIGYGFTNKGLTADLISVGNQDLKQFSDAFVHSLKEIKHILEKSSAN